MKTQCPHCKHLFEVEDDIGKDVYCQNCKQSFVPKSYLDEAAANILNGPQEMPYTPLFENSSSVIRLCGILLVIGGILFSIFLNILAGLITFIGGVIIIALACILKKLEQIAQDLGEKRNPA